MGERSHEDHQQNERTPIRRYRTASTGSSSTYEDNATEDVSLLSLHWKNKLIGAIMCWTDFCSGLAFSLLGPFFPKMGVLKGLTVTQTGVIIGIFELMIVITSPIFGNYLAKFGSKFVYVMGVFVGGVSCILFGFLENCPGGVIFIVLCLAVRMVQGTAVSAYSTASYTIMANTFPKNVAAMFGLLETVSTVGVMIGPPFGGVLYDKGGFKLPFIVNGAMVTLSSLLGLIVIPRQEEKCESRETSVLGLLKSVKTIIYVNLSFAVSAAISFTVATLSIHLDSEYNLSPTVIGVVYVTGPGLYALSAPLWGLIGDKKPQYINCILVCGFIFGGFSFWFLGPAPFFNIPSNQLWLVIVALAASGIGLGVFVYIFPLMFRMAVELGFDEDLDTSAIIAGIFNSSYSLGGFLGPVVGGVLVDKIRFSWSAVVIGSFVVFSGFLLLVHHLHDRYTGASGIAEENLDKEENRLLP